MKKRILIYTGAFVLVLIYIFVVNNISSINSIPKSSEASNNKTSNYTHEVTATPYRKSVNDLDINFLDSKYSSGYYTITYKITNNGKESFKYIQVKVYYLDANKEVLTTDWTYAVGSEGIRAGDSQEFDVMTKSPSSGDVKWFRTEIIDYN